MRSESVARDLRVSRRVDEGSDGSPKFLGQEDFSSTIGFDDDAET